MGRVFMSPLGTNKYHPSHYVIEGTKSEEAVPFVQEALLAHFCKEWGEEDRVLIFCTEKAKEKNWLDGGNFERGLCSRIDALGLRAPCTMVPIPDGRNEREMMDIFMILIEQLRPGDQVFLDITHSFRSLPLLQTVIVNYAKVLKNIQVERIVYGAFETLGTAAEVQHMPLEERLAPVFDLTPYDALLDWARAVDIFRKAGRPQEIKRLVSRNVGPILAHKESRSANPVAERLSRFAKALETLCQDLAAVRGPKLAKAKGLGEEITEVEDQDLIAPLTPLFELLRDKLQRFETPDPEAKGFEAAAWCLEHELIFQAYAIARETVLSGLCRCWGHDPLDEATREGFWSGLLHVVATKKSMDQWEGLVRERREEAQRVISQGGESIKKLAQEFEKIRDRRNDLLHGGWKKDTASAESLVDFLRKGGLTSLRTAWEAYRAEGCAPWAHGHRHGGEGDR
ncbi:MAG: TIGR02221 family CRISPR-associated protein [Desulfosoma sp.]